MNNTTMKSICTSDIDNKLNSINLLVVIMLQTELNNNKQYFSFKITTVLEVMDTTSPNQFRKNRTL
jgi:hypothetical protein